MENDEELLKIIGGMRPRYVCTCHLIKEEEIVRAIHEAKIRDLFELTLMTKASTKCGSCSRKVADIFYREMQKIEENKYK